VVLRGSAVECRIYAEDPENNFFPSPGKIKHLRTPAGPGIRDDSGVYEGWTVPIDYDPLISKLVAWGSTRSESIERMKRALREYHLEGIQTNVSFFLEILDHPDFQRGELDTGFIDRWLENRQNKPAPSVIEQDFAVVAAALHYSRQQAPVVQAEKEPESLWKTAGRARALRRT
jgi:acetyl-CoA carboxylase biotin carboxylase subunit